MHVIDSFEICLVIFAVGDAVLYANFKGLNADCKVWGVASRVLCGCDVTGETYAWLAGCWVQLGRDCQCVSISEGGCTLVRSLSL
jgi:hypothetical protein